MCRRLLAATVVILAGQTAIRPAAALTILPDFTSSITGAANAAAVEAAIDNSIATIDSLYSNTGGISIVFQQSAGTFLGQSETFASPLTYSAYVADLRATSSLQPTNTVLATALANLSSGNDANGAKPVAVTTADAFLALRQSGATGCFNSSGSVVSGCGTNYYGVITLSTSYTMNYGKTAVAGAYSAIDTVSHEIDEVLGGGGQGSMLNAVANASTPLNGYVGALDLYRYSAPRTPNFTTVASTTAPPYFSVDGGVTDIVGFNQSSGGDFADFATGTNVQSAFSSSGTVATYNAASPETAMMASIGYNPVIAGGSSVPEPGSLAIAVSGLTGLLAMRRRKTAS